MLCSGCSIASAEVSGYLSTYLIGQSAVDTDDQVLIDSAISSQTSLRLMFSDHLNERISVDVHYALQPLASTLSLTSVGSSTVNSYRYSDLKSPAHHFSDHAQLHHNLDRLSVAYSGDNFDVRFGRQAIALGSARFINPTDLFLPFSVQTLDQEYRRGVDALRLQWYVSDTLTADMAVVVGDDARQSTSGGYATLKQNLSFADLSYSIMAIKDMRLIGAGLEGALGDAGVWAEWAYADWQSQRNQDSYHRLSIGADYSLTDSLYVAGEYHYSGAYRCQPQQYLQCYQQPAYTNAGVNLLGEHYLIASLGYTKSALTTVNLTSFINLSDQSTLITLAADRSLADNLYMGVGVYVNLGRSPSTAIVMGSEFGSAPSVLFGNLRYYF